MTNNFLVVLLLLFRLSRVVDGQCPPNSTIEPCFCIPGIPYDIFPPYYELRPQITAIHGKSIVCENIDNSSFDLRSVFVRLSAIFGDNNSSNQTHFDGFFLHNTRIRHLPENIFDQLTFSGVIFHKNPLLTSIDANAFAGTREYLEVFQTFNTNLSETSGLFPALRTLINLRIVSMHDDQLQSIPDYAFNHTRLTEIWLGLEMGPTSQPIRYIGDYPFYHVPKLTTLRMSSPFLDRISKYAFAQRNRSTIGVDDLSRMLFIQIGSPMLNGTSFEATSFTRFRNRPVFLRFYNTSITYLDETIFQPFLETHPASLLDVKNSQISETCDCRSEWIFKDYCRSQQDSRVYGTSCCSSAFFRNCTSSVA